MFLLVNLKYNETDVQGKVKKQNLNLVVGEPIDLYQEAEVKMYQYITDNGISDWSHRIRELKIMEVVNGYFEAAAAFIVTVKRTYLLESKKGGTRESTKKYNVLLWAKDLDDAWEQAKVYQETVDLELCGVKEITGTTVQI